MKNSFAGRKNARALAMQGMYSWLISDNDIYSIEEFLLADEDLFKSALDKSYFHLLLHESISRIPELDLLFIDYLDRKITDLGLVELSILRLAAYELKFIPKIPYRVVLNEALELAKEYGPVDSHKFINGILDKVVKNKLNN